MRTHLLLPILGLVACSSVPPAEPFVEPDDPCPVAQEEVIPEYNSKDWGRWVDADKDCQDTRQEVLIRDSTVAVTLDEKGCRVVTGSWTDPYDGRVVTDPSKIDIDHVIAKKDAHESGGWGWTDEDKKAFANDMSNLKATSASTNRSKGARGPDEWLPPLETVRCSYIQEWVGLKEGYELGMSEFEYGRITYMMEVCSKGGVPALPQG